MQSINFEYATQNTASASDRGQLQTVDHYHRNPYRIIMHKVTFNLYAKAWDVNQHVWFRTSTNPWALVLTLLGVRKRRRRICGVLLTANL
jgi:hypothetical protein